MTFFYLGLQLALCSVYTQSAPVPTAEDTQQIQIMNSSEFQQATEHAYSLMTRILDKIPEVNDWIDGRLKLEEKDQSNLQYLKGILNFSDVPVLEPLSDNFTLETCLSQIVKGLEYHKTLLKVIRKLAHSKSEELNGLLFDIRDLLEQIHKMQELIEAADLSEQPLESQLEAGLLPKLNNSYMTKVAAHLALIQLKMFGENVSRSLRSMIL